MVTSADSVIFVWEVQSLATGVKVQNEPLV